MPPPGKNDRREHSFNYLANNRIKAIIQTHFLIVQEKRFIAFLKIFVMSDAFLS